MDNAFHDCFSECWLCNHPLRNKEPKMTPTQSGHSRQSEKCHILFLESKTPKLMADISFLTHSAGKPKAMFFPLQMPSCLPLRKLYIALYCCLLTQHYVEEEGLFNELRQASFLSLSYQECWSLLTLSFLFFC